MSQTPVSPDRLAACWAEVRTQSPLTQCLTNIVVAPFTANVLLAAGAAPAMVDNPHEAGDFARVAGGVLVNLGTPYDDTSQAMRAAVRGAREVATPWVLDPVAAGLAWRTSLARELLETAAPAIIRGNASEILALGGGAGGRGVDATHSTDDSVETARSLARSHGCAVAVSGPVDRLTDGTRSVEVHNGDALMTRVTGVGCALGALMAAAAAVEPDPLLAATTATAALTVAADGAAAASAGPGSFAVALLDELAVLEADTLAERVRLA
ncbi:hydroxyethylthiazole kinase [Serinicoccus sp. CNJ-927]|uniref:hydroxyethylthiazole kinase n=1 Tax=Serinicoccus sp. CNJ-927 TaxID=1904970 RepID=UPI00095F95F1|nr:hydroxyethylthiazole kinase [Serinicoccus sp. CNJ-927]OLT38921.1 hydroxyethylthiazole kinase [Serinicoccus sp. CNJ-927]